MMQCPSCSAPLLSSEARCVSCHALVNPQAQGTSALAPRLVTPQSLAAPGPAEGSQNPPEVVLSPAVSEAKVVDPKVSDDDAWRREVLERVRKRRQLRAHALPLFVDGQPVPSGTVAAPSPLQDRPTARSASLADADAMELDEVIEEIPDSFGNVAPLPPAPAPDLLASLDVPLDNASAGDPVADLPLRPTESPSVSRARSVELPAQSLVERPHPVLVNSPVTPRSLVGDLPLVEPSRLEPVVSELPPRTPAATVSSRAASMSDRVQAAFIDVGMWSAMSAIAFYFASRIARTSILGLGPAWHGLTLFAVVLAAAYILFFGGLSGATPGKIACGIQVRRYDGSSLGPLPSLLRGVLGILGVAFLGLGIWPAFWDKDRRALHDRATDSRVTIV